MIMRYTTLITISTLTADATGAAAVIVHVCVEDAAGVAVPAAGPGATVCLLVCA